VDLPRTAATRLPASGMQTRAPEPTLDTRGSDAGFCGRRDGRLFHCKARGGSELSSPGVAAGVLSFSLICRAFLSGGTRIRTGDTMIFSHVLYQLSYPAGG
jgi:hypothetical protein